MRSKCVVALISAALLAACSERPAAGPADDEQGAREVTVEQLAAAPAEFRGSRVVVTGRLASVGANYFTDLRIVLEEPDGSDATIHVRPWLPVELPPSPPGAKAERPPVLSDYLGRTVELTAIVTHGPLKHVGSTDYLAVESARRID